MSNQAHTKVRQDVAKKRREYLQTAAWSGTMGCCGWSLMVGFGLLTVLSVGAFVLSITGNYGLPSLMWLFPALLTGSVTYLGFNCISTAHKMADDNDYVPPVREQIDTLPADEILVRGSDEPTAKPDELLRAPQAAVAEPAEELLRAEQDANEGPPDR